jgi:hypothetical protein
MLGAIVQRAMLAMFDTRQELPLCGTVTFQLIRDKDPRDVGEPLEQLVEEPLGGSRVPVTLDQYVKGVAILVQGPPQIVASPRQNILYAGAHGSRPYWGNMRLTSIQGRTALRKRPSRRERQPVSSQQVTVVRHGRLHSPQR